VVHAGQHLPHNAEVVGRDPVTTSPGGRGVDRDAFVGNLFERALRGRVETVFGGDVLKR